MREATHTAERGIRQVHPTHTCSSLRQGPTGSASGNIANRGHVTSHVEAGLPTQRRAGAREAASTWTSRSCSDKKTNIAYLATCRHTGLDWKEPSHRKRREDIGEEDYAIRLVVPPRLERNLRRQFRVLRPLPKGRVLRAAKGEETNDAETKTKRVCSTQSYSPSGAHASSGSSDRVRLLHVWCKRQDAVGVFIHTRKNIVSYCCTAVGDQHVSRSGA